MDADACRREAQRGAEAARRLMEQPAGLDGHDWGLIVAHLAAADEALLAARKLDPTIDMPLLNEAIEELVEITANFTRSDFLNSTRAARRNRPGLFVPRR